MRIKKRGAMLTYNGRKTSKAKRSLRKREFQCPISLRRRRLGHISKAKRFESVLKNNDQIAREGSEKDDHCIRVRDLSPSPEPECDTQDQSKGQNGDSLPRINPISGKFYIVNWVKSGQYFAGLCLPLDGLEYIIGESAEMAGLLSDIPSCYLYDSGSKSFSWNPDYERNGRKRSERYFAFVFFDGLEFPSQSSLAWVHIDHFEEWDKEKAKKIEHSQQAINYIKEEAKSQNRQYGSDDKIPDSEANNGPFSGFPVRLPSRNLQPRSNEGDLEIMLNTQKKPEVSIEQEKPTSLQYYNGKAGKRPTRVTPRRNLRAISLRYRNAIHRNEAHSQVDSENQDVADINEETKAQYDHGKCQCKSFCDSGCSNLYALISCDNETCNAGQSACENRLTLEGEGRLAKRTTKAYGMELYLNGDDVDKGAKLARYSGSRIPGDDLRRLRKETDDHIIKGHYVVQRKYSDLFVDAEHEDIIAKYANHSCQPNCELQEWLGSRGPRLFLVASEPIERGDPITFEYNPKDAPTSVRVRFNEQVHDQGICYCASPSCHWTPSEAVQGVLGWIEKQDQCPNRMEANPQTIRITLPRNPTLIHYTLNSRLSIKDQLLHLRTQLEDKLLILE